MRTRGTSSRDLSETSIDLGTSDITGRVHPSRKKTFTVTNRGSLPFASETEIDVSGCPRTNVQDFMEFKTIFAPGPAPASQQPVVGAAEPAGWAKAGVDWAVTEGLLPAQLQGAYDQPIDMVK